MIKQKPLNSRCWVSCPKAKRPFGVEDRLTASYTFGQRVVGYLWWVMDFIISYPDDGYLDVDYYLLHPARNGILTLILSILLNPSTFYGAAIQITVYDEPKQRPGRLRGRLQARNDFNVNMGLNGKFAYCIRKLTIWCNKDQTDLLEIQSCKPNCWCLVLIKLAQLLKNDQEKWRRWRRCRQI